MEESSINKIENEDVELELEDVELEDVELKTDFNDLKYKIIIQKKEFVFLRISKNKYKLITTISNKNIFIKKLVNFHIIQLLYEINKDFFDSIKLNINDNGDKAYLCIMLRNLFEKLGFKQQCLSLQLTKSSPNDSTYIFFGKKDTETIKQYMNLINKSDNFEIIPVDIFKITIKLKDLHSLELTLDIELNETTRQITYIIEKAFAMGLKHVFLKTKKFIENLKT